MIGTSGLLIKRQSDDYAIVTNRLSVTKTAIEGSDKQMLKKKGTSSGNAFHPIQMLEDGGDDLP